MGILPGISYGDALCENPVFWGVGCVCVDASLQRLTTRGRQDDHLWRVGFRRGRGGGGFKHCSCESCRGGNARVEQTVVVHGVRDAQPVFRNGPFPLPLPFVCLFVWLWVCVCVCFFLNKHFASFSFSPLSPPSSFPTLMEGLVVAFCFSFAFFIVISIVYVSSLLVFLLTTVWLTKKSLLPPLAYCLFIFRSAFFFRASHAGDRFFFFCYLQLLGISTALDPTRTHARCGRRMRRCLQFSFVKLSVRPTPHPPHTCSLHRRTPPT